MATAGAGGMADAGGLPGGSLSPDSGADAGRVAFRISSPDFDNIEGCGPDGAAPDICGRFDNDNTRFGADLSPEFNWTPGPEGTQSYALALHDLSFNMNGGPFTHWVIWNIPASESGLAAAFLGGTLPGIPAANTEQRSFEADNEFTGSGGAGNVYEFVLYALSANSVDFANENSTDVIQDALDASGALLGTTTMRARSNP